MFEMTDINGLLINAAGLVALAELTTIAERTEIIGSASRLDTLVLAPGIHIKGNQPAMAALTTGYVFRVENQAMVSSLKSIGLSKIEQFLWRWYCFKCGILTLVLYLICPLLTLGTLSFFVYIKEWWGIGALLALILARLIDVIVIRRRSRPGLKGTISVCKSCFDVLTNSRKIGTRRAWISSSSNKPKSLDQD
ncbi:Similar to hypothetical protein CC1G_03479 [Coprinopsis cinerea okayama7|uniref:Uncharacterized protein n=1 Tax=Pyronema omphalodes (strain CBS 100304) TaxID=1076935 RepID=U4LAV9_PYROM|nr:Similar to hypothetical protein CC1G_03479 [Coprinopsis cinerea okayama7\